MNRRLFTLLLALIPYIVSAEMVEIDGISYNLISKTESAEVVRKADGTKYSGAIVIPEEIMFNGKKYSVTIIGERAFYSCRQLETVILPKSITTVKEKAFGESGLKTITIPASIINFEKEAFWDCNNLEVVYISDLTCWCNSRFGSFNSNPLGNRAHLVLNGAEIIDLTIPPSIAKINPFAFSGCKWLTSITITQGVTEIGREAFAYCENVSSVSVPNGLVSIEDGAFHHCYELKTLTLPTSVSHIGNSAFSEAGLSSLVIPDLVATIEPYTFMGCQNLSSISIPNSVKTVGVQAFYGCPKLVKISLGNGINDIQDHAFQKCQELSEVRVFAEEVPNTTIDAFDDSYINYATLCVPYGTAAQYSKVSPWKDFGEIIEMQKSTFTLTYFVDGEYYKAYEMNEGDEIPPEPSPNKEGYTFSGWNGLPETMPAHDVTVMGSFAINTYNLTYVLDWQELKTVEMPFGAAITPEQKPTKEGYQFVGWSCLPETMQAHDVTAYGTFQQPGKFMYGFRWEEEETTSTGMPQITLTVGEQHRMRYSYSSSEMPEDIFYLARGGNWVAYERKFIEGLGNTDVVVDCPEIFSVAPNGVVTAHKEGVAALKPTGYIQRGGGPEKCYIKVVKNYEELESNNDIGNANELKGAPTSFCLQNFTDQDFFKVKVIAGDAITFKVIGSYTPHLGYRWAAYSPSGSSLGDGALGTNEETGEREISIDSSLTQIFGNGYYYLQIYFNQALSQYFSYNDFLTVQAFINGKPIQKKLTFQLKYMLDGSEYRSYMLEEGTAITPEPAPVREGCTFSGWSEIPATMPAHDVTVTGTLTKDKYKLAYILDGLEYKSYMLDYGAAINPEPAPAKEGYTFSGWSNIPATMPAHDVTVTGSFTINTYKLTYMVDGEVYKTKNLEYGAKIPVEPNPSKEGYTFSGWDSVPSIMPAHDVTVKGTFAINKYKLTYLMNGELFKEYLVEYQAKMPVPEIPYDDGYDYSYVYEQLNMVNLRYGGVMPAWDVTVDLFLYPRSFKLTYMLDGKEYKVVNQLYDTEITPEPAPEKEGYSFSGWEGLPERMPAKDVTATGTMTVNKYKLTYVIDGEVYKTLTLEYGATVTIEPNPTKEGHTFMGWSNLPQIMPAHDVTVTGSFTVNKYVLTYLLDGMLYKTLEVDYGSTIIPEPAPERDGYSFSGWIGLPETMPAHMVIVTGTFTSGIVTLEQLPQGSYRIYTPDGKLLNKPRKGLNIVVMADGTVKKLVVKEKE